MAAETEKPVLKYIGGGGFLPNVPARDLTADDLSALDGVDRKTLIKSGLYEPAEAPAKEK